MKKYRSAYTEALRKDREERKKKQRRFEMKEKLKSLNPFRVKEKKDDGSPPIRTFDSSNRFRDQRPSWFSRRNIQKRPGEVVSVVGYMQRYNDLNLVKSERNEALEGAEFVIRNSPQMNRYLRIHGNFRAGGGLNDGILTAETQKFINDSIGNYPKSRDQQYKFAVALYLVSTDPIYLNEIQRSGAEKRFLKWYERYNEVDE